MYRIVGGDGRVYGPVPEDQVRGWIAEGRANARTKAQREEDADWRPLSEFPEFASVLWLPSPSAPAEAATAGAPGGAAYVPVAPRTNGMAVAGLVMGIFSLLFGWLCCAITSVLGIIFSSIGISQINKNPTLETGKGMAVAGLALSIISLVLSAAVNIFFLVIRVLEDM